MLSAISLAMESARPAASVRYCESDCDETAVPPIATRPRMPSAKIRIATIASMRKKPACEDARLIDSARTAVSCRGHGVARVDLASRRYRDSAAANLSAQREARARGGIGDVDPVRGVADRAAEAGEGDP